MHKVEIRLTNEGNDDAANVFELYSETYRDGGYVEMAPMQSVAGGGPPIVMFLEPDERVIVVSKGNKGKIVFDKEQNANVRVETDEEKKQRAEYEARVAVHQADQAVIAAQAEVESAKEASEQSQRSAASSLKKAEAEKAKIEAAQAKNRATAAEQTPPGTTKEPEKEPAKPFVPPLVTPTTSSVSPPSNPPGNPASANTGPVDSKQVKADAPGTTVPAKDKP